jgi:hypothetical protein
VLAALLAACSAPDPITLPPGPSGDPASGPASDEAPRELALARERWEAAGPAAYEMTLRRSCFCPPDWRGPFRVTVRDGAVASVTYEGAPVDAERAVTVDALFDLVADAAARRAERLDVVYDPDWGYPARLFIDYDARIADEEVGYEVEAFRPLDG